MRSFLRRLCKSYALADDLAQECFIKAYNNFDQLNTEAAAQFWLFGIAYRCFLDHNRKETRRRHLIDMVPETNQTVTMPSSRLDLEAAMGTLSSDCRACVILCLAYGYTHEDTAALTNLALGTVKSHIQRGKKRLKTFLQDYERVG